MWHTCYEGQAWGHVLELALVLAVHPHRQHLPSVSVPPRFLQPPRVAWRRPSEWQLAHAPALPLALLLVLLSARLVAQPPRVW